MNIGIYGYGNLGRGVLAVVNLATDVDRLGVKTGLLLGNVGINGFEGFRLDPCHL